MDVTSLLNSNPAAAEQQKRAGSSSSSSREPSRSRTPWDAGGYSLPINTAAHVDKTLQQQLQPEQHRDGSYISTPPSSPKHRLSDSRSSLSSFASSLQSTTHSRYSSTSTLNSNSHAYHKSFGTEILSPDLRSIFQSLRSATQALAIDSCKANDSRQTSLSPNSSTLEQLATVEECHLPEQESGSSSRGVGGAVGASVASLDAENVMKSNTSTRPGSPSDAILIKRPWIPSLQVDTGDLNGYSRQVKYLSSVLPDQPSSLQNKNHKRTLSAPNFRPASRSSFLSPHILNTANSYYYKMENSSDADQDSKMEGIQTSIPRVNSVTVDNISVSTANANEADIPITSAPVAVVNSSIASTTNVSVTTSMATLDKNTTPVGPIAEPTPPSSQHPDHASPTNLPPHSTPDTPPILTPIVNSQTIVCMYIPNCDTGSQMRKAISHIFGRNKMCTRLIPQHVWVHYCRKHYQRSRYRNPKEYAKLQCDLVQEQIRRIHYWSEENRKAHHRSGVVQHWTLAVRKREQKRIDELERKESKKRKRPTANAEDDDEDDEDFDHEPATAVPTWLYEKCRNQRYTTQEICEIFNALHREILGDNSTATFPDLEILPNITADANEPKSPKGYVKRSSISAGHRRSHSLGVVTSTQRRWENEPPTYDPPLQKKHRPNSNGNDEQAQEREFPSLARHGIAQCSNEGSRNTQHHSKDPSRRPVFSNIDEHQDEYKEEYKEIPNRQGYYPRSPPSLHIPLAAPIPIRNTGYPLASQLENGGDVRCPSHGRSQSDISFMPNYRYGYPHHIQEKPGYYENPYDSGPSSYQDVAYYSPRRDHQYSPTAARIPMADIDRRARHSHEYSRPAAHPTTEMDHLRHRREFIDYPPATRPPMANTGYRTPLHGHTYSLSAARPPLSDMYQMRNYNPTHSRHQSTPMMQYNPQGPYYPSSPPNLASSRHHTSPPTVSRIIEDKQTQELYSNRR